jgi:hypothetical protein
VANGELHVVVPNKLLAFCAPTDLPDGSAWMDNSGTRRFSASYYPDTHSRLRRLGRAMLQRRRIS